jgi:hypothetical protein
MGGAIIKKGTSSTNTMVLYHVAGTPRYRAPHRLRSFSLFAHPHPTYPVYLGVYKRVALGFRNRITN